MSGSLSQYRPSNNEAWSIYDMIAHHFVHFGATIVPAGSLSYNPRADSFGDIDVIVGTDCLNSIEGALAGIFGKNKNGSPRTQGIIGQSQVDVFLVENRYMGAAIVFYTNPLPLQFALRAIAAAKGYSLTPKGLKERDSGDYVKTESASDVYRILEVKEFTTEQRQRVLSYKIEKPEVIENV